MRSWGRKANKQEGGVGSAPTAFLPHRSIAWLESAKRTGVIRGPPPVWLQKGRRIWFRMIMALMRCKCNARPILGFGKDSLREKSTAALRIASCIYVQGQRTPSPSHYGYTYAHEYTNSSETRRWLKSLCLWRRQKILKRRI